MATDIVTTADFLAAIDAFLREKEMSPSRFGRSYMSDPGFVASLRRGRHCASETMARVVMAVRRDHGPEALPLPRYGAMGEARGGLSG